jgi:hypothetical protein
VTKTLTEAEAKVLAARGGATLDDKAAANAVVAMAPHLAKAEEHAAALGFEDEPSTYLAVRARCRR